MSEEKYDGWVCDEGKRLSNTVRQNSYGHPIDDWSKTAKMWSAVLTRKLKEDITAEEAAMMMVCVKMSREANMPKDDNVVDMAGYVNVLDIIKRERARREAEKDEEGS